MNEEEGNIEEKRGVKLGEMDLGLNLFKGKGDQKLEFFQIYLIMKI